MILFVFRAESAAPLKRLLGRSSKRQQQFLRAHLGAAPFYAQSMLAKNPDDYGKRWLRSYS